MENFQEFCYFIIYWNSYNRDFIRSYTPFLKSEGVHKSGIFWHGSNNSSWHCVFPHTHARNREYEIKTYSQGIKKFLYHNFNNPYDILLHFHNGANLWRTDSFRGMERIVNHIWSII